MSNRISFLLFALFLFSFSTAYTQDECTAATGYWSDLEEEHPFLCNEIDQGGTLLIPAGVVVTVDEKLKLLNNTVLIVEGTLFFDGNTSRLDFPEGSGLQLAKGGVINTNVSNNSQRIRIGNRTHWTSKDGKTHGPINYGAIPLPVELLSFDAQVQGETVALEWATASETNSDFFALEHSLTGHSFTTLDQLLAAGTTSEKQYYQYDHSPASSGDHYYRLRQVDLDGSAFFSAVKVVKVTTKELFSLRTSADFNEIHLQFRSSFSARAGNIRIFDYSGRLLQAQQQLLSNEEITLDISTYEIGTYVVQVEYAGQLMAKPFVKMAS